MNNPPRYDEVFVKGSAELFADEFKKGEDARSVDIDAKIARRKELGMSLNCTADELDATPGFPVQPVLTYEEVCNVLALQEKVDLLTAENLHLKTDNKNLIEMNFNLEKQLQAKSEDLEDALEACESWEERCDSLEDDKADLVDQIESIRELLG